MVKGTRSAEAAFLDSLEPKEYDLPGCMALDCLKDASSEPAMPEVLLCSTHWYRIQRLPDIQAKREADAERLRQSEERYVAEAARRKALAAANEAAQEAIKNGTMGSVVYYLRFEKHIKIGTTHNLKKRMARMSLHPDSLLAAELGDRAIEQQRHAMFLDERFRKTELFSPSERLLEHIEHVKSHCGDPKRFLHI